MEGVSETTTTFGLDIRCRLSTAFLRQCNAACTALTGLKTDGMETMSQTNHMQRYICRKSWDVGLDVLYQCFKNQTGAH